MKCHAGVEFSPGTPCPKCNARLGEVCWPGINADLLEVIQLRKRVAQLETAISFWKAARYPEIYPEPHDIKGRCQVQAGLDLAESTLYEIVIPVPVGGRPEPQ